MAYRISMLINFASRFIKENVLSVSISTVTAVNPLNNIKAAEVIQSASIPSVLLADTGVVKVGAVLATDDNDKVAENLLAQARGYWDTWSKKNQEIDSVLKEIHPTDHSVSPPTHDKLRALTDKLEVASDEQALAMHNWTRTVAGLVELQPISKNLSSDIVRYMSENGEVCLSRWVNTNKAFEEMQQSLAPTWNIEMNAEGRSRGTATQGLASVLRGLLKLESTVKSASGAFTDFLLKRVALVTGLPNNQTAGVNIEQQLDRLVRAGMLPDNVLWSRMAATLRGVQENYVDVYKDAMSKYVDFEADFDAEVVAKVSIQDPKIEGRVNEDNSSQFLYFQAGELQSDARKLYNKYFDENTGLAKDRAVLFPDQGAGSALTGKSKSEAEQWAKEMGLSVERCVMQLPDGKYIVQIDRVPLKIIIDGLSGKGGNIRSQRYDSWRHLFDAQVEDVRKSTKALSEQDSHANKVYENLQQILSALIEACVAVAKDYLKP